MTNPGPRRIVGTSACIWCAEPINIYDNSAKSNYPKYCRSDRCQRMNRRVIWVFTGRYRRHNRKTDIKRRFARLCKNVAIIVDMWKAEKAAQK